MHTKIIYTGHEVYRVTKYPHGTFSWAENISTDAASASAYYQELFGWSRQDVAMGENQHYTLFQLDDAKVAALMAMPPVMQETGAASFWANYVTVDDVDSLAPAVASYGGAILFGPADVGDSGRMLYMEDAAGAQLGLWQPGAHIGAGIINVPGAMLWNELLTWDAQASMEFYWGLLGWEFFEAESGYIFILNQGRNNGGFLKLDESFGDVAAHWRTYFHSDDIDRAIGLTRDRGGEIHFPKLEIPGEGHFTFVSDPAGARFYLMDKFELEPWIE